MSSSQPSFRNSSSQNRLALRGVVLVALSAAGLAVPLITGWSRSLPPSLAWGLDLISHWQWLFAAGVLLGVGLSLVARRWRVLPLLALAATPVLTASPRQPDGAATGAPLTVATANVFVGSEDPQKLLTWLAEKKVDVAVLLEVSPAYARALEKLALDFPHRKVIASDDPFGLAILSRTPLTHVQVRQLSAGMDYLEARTTYQGRAISLTAMHTMPPFSPGYFVARDQDLELALREARAGAEPAVVAGDLNASAWSSALRLAESYGFRRATGLAPTWHTSLQGVLGIPIDQVLVSPEWAVVQSERGPAIGSDHFPVLARLALRR